MRFSFFGSVGNLSRHPMMHGYSCFGHSLIFFSNQPARLSFSDEFGERFSVSLMAPAVECSSDLLRAIGFCNREPKDCQHFRLAHRFQDLALDDADWTASHRAEGSVVVRNTLKNALA